MFCENCGKELENDAKVCPACGTAVEAEQPEETVTEQPAEVAAEPVAEQPAEVAAEPVAEQPVKTAVVEQPVETATQKMPQQKMGQVKEKMKKIFNTPKKMMVGIAVAAVTLVVLTTGVAFAGPISRAIAPEKAYRKAEQKYLENIVEDLLVSYDNVIDNLKNYDNIGSEMELSLSVGEPVLQLIDELAGVEIEKNQKIGLRLDYGTKGKTYLLKGALLWGKKELVSPELVVDTEESELYVTIPELNKKEALLFDIKDLTGVDISDAFEESAELMERLAKVYPKSKTLQKMMSSYLEAALAEIDDKMIEHSKEELKVGKVAQKCTEYTITMDAKDLAQVGIAFLEAMQEDERIEELMVAFVDAIDEKGLDGDDAYKAFEEGIDYLVKELEDFDDDMEIEMIVYLGSDGEIYGREIKVEYTEETYYEDYNWHTDEYETYTETEEYEWTVSMLTPESGKKWAMELEIGDKDTTYFELSGEGTLSGKKRSGELEGKVSVIDIGVLQLKDVSLENALRGELSGTFTYLLGEIDGIKELKNELLDEVDDLPRSVGKIVEDMIDELDTAAIKVTVDGNSKKASATTSLMLGEEALLTCTANAATTSGEKAKIPSNAVDISDEDDLMDWVEDIEFDDVLKQLEKKGVPEDLVDLLDELIEYYLD